MRGIGDERALSGKRLGQPVEHVVEGVAEHAHLARLALGVVDPRVQIAGVHTRRDRGHPPQRARDARADQVGRQQRTRQREDPGEDERPRHARLRVRDPGQRLAHADRDVGAVAQTYVVLEQAQLADVAERQRRVAAGAREQRGRERVLVRLFGRALTVVGPGRVGEELRAVGDGAATRDVREQHDRAGREGLIAHVLARLGVCPSARRSPATGEIVREAVGVAGDLAVDLLAQLGARAAVDGDERDARAEQRHECDPAGQPPAQTDPREAFA